MAEQWHGMSPEHVASELGVTPADGLSEDACVDRLERVGPNELVAAERAPWWRLLLAQFQDLMVLILLGATAVSYALGEQADAITIIAIVLVNACLGFVQEFRAERSLEALRQMAAPTARVRRGGIERQVPANLVVPGDLLLLEAGDRIAADVRLLEAFSMEAEEAALTGESLPVRKRADWLAAADVPLGDRKNMAFAGTTVTRGRGAGLVVATGMATEMGRIADLMQEVEEEETPLQRRLEALGRMLVVACLGVCAVVVATGVLRGEPLTVMFLSGVSLAVAAIPEGLPAIVTVALALGVQRMIRHGAIVRRLQAVETLGCATVICSDKTGTLTRNEMMVRAIWTGEGAWEVTGDGYAPYGEFRQDGQQAPLGASAAQMLQTAALCSNASLAQVRPRRRGLGKRQRPVWTVQGDPTEGALCVAGAKAGVDLNAYARLWEVPFESERRRMSVGVSHRPSGEVRLCVKGAPDTIVAHCTQILLGERLVPFTDEHRQQVAAQVERLAAAALRVLAVATRTLPGDLSGREQADWEEELTFLGLVGMIDPPRPEVKAAVGGARTAGVATVMITGDHPATARAVADELGIGIPGGKVWTGAELDALTDDDLARTVDEARIFARVSPSHKLRIVRAFKARGEIVAMTGDGVNDAPAVKEADIGVAMGRTGTDVTKEASAMILSDDNYATIVAAVAEGRSIYDNIRKFIRYLLACNTGEVLTMFLATVMKLPLPLLPGQILLVNLVTDGLPAMALGVDPPDPDVMKRPPRSPDEGPFARGLSSRILTRGLLIGIATLVAFVWGLWPDGPQAPDGLMRARTLSLATLVMSQLFHVFDCRSETRSVWEIGLFSNPWLVAAVCTSVTALVGSIYWAPLAAIFRTAPLTGGDWGVVLLAAAAGQIFDLLRRRLWG